LIEHKVIFFRDQPITTSQHLDFARQFGDLEVHPVNPKEGLPEVLVLHNDADRPPLGTAYNTPAIKGMKRIAGRTLGKLLPFVFRRIIRGQ
jgi:hypothetical protein